MDDKTKHAVTTIHKSILDQLEFYEKELESIRKSPFRKSREHIVKGKLSAYGFSLFTLEAAFPFLGNGESLRIF